MGTQPGSGFFGWDKAQGGLLRGMQVGEAAGDPGGSGVGWCLWAMTDGLQSVRQSLSVINDDEVEIGASACT